MATKTQRILDMLPGTFAAQVDNSPLASLARTYGTELQDAENALAAIMRAHWSDQADLGAPTFEDLPKFAALYGLAPHPDDEVEEFRRRLKLWVQLILEGPATVRGMLRATSILTGLEIDDSDSVFDAWWNRSSDNLTTLPVSRRDAGPAVFGFDRAVAIGADAKPAQFMGSLVLSDPVDLSAGAALRLAVDGGAMTLVDLAAAPAATTPEEIVERINTEFVGQVAQLRGGRLELTSLSTGGAGELELGDGPDDAAPAILGRPSLRYFGTDAASAVFAGVADLSAGADLSSKRFLRLRVDDTHLAEIDCAGANPAVTTLDEITSAINAGLGLTVATHDGQALVLSSPTSGIGSSLTFLSPAAQDATLTLFGPVNTVVTGADAAPATLTGTTDLSTGADLSAADQLLISIDGEPPVQVACAGADPANTQLPEIVAAINATLRNEVARHNGRNLILSALEPGPAGALELGQATERDAAQTLLGLLPRRVQGLAAQRATLHGQVDLTSGIRLAAHPLLQLAIDHRPPEIFDLSAAASAGPLDAAGIAAALNSLAAAPFARAENGRPILESASEGGAGEIALLPLAHPLSRRFVSRTPILEDAAQLVLGTLSAQAQGTAATAARIIGTNALTSGVDLSAGRHLRVSIDNAPPIEIDCAGPRPRNTTAEEVQDALEDALGPSVAQLESGNLLSLTSSTVGIGSRLVLSQPRATDALESIIGFGPLVALGQAARQVSFSGTTDLSGGVDLSADAFLRLAIDGGAPVEVNCAGPNPTATTLGQIAIAINVTIGVNVASHDGTRLLITSPTKGADSELSILTPSAGDATLTILGIAPERHYRGAAAKAAVIEGVVDLSAGADLTTARFLRIGVDTAPPLDIDCAAGAEVTDAVSADEIASSINAALDDTVASVVADRLVLKAPEPGASSRLELASTTAGNAAAALFGNAPVEAKGLPAAPATLTGAIDLRSGVDLSQRSVLRIVLDDNQIADIDIAGMAPEVTAPDEITAAINARFADMASIDADGHLSLTAQDGATLAVTPLRHFELIEYLPDTATLSATGLTHGDAVFVENTGVTETAHDVALTSVDGTGSPGLVNLDSGWELRLRGALPPKAQVTITATQAGLAATVTDSENKVLQAPRVFGLPLVPHLDFPENVSRAMAAGADGRRRLVLTGQAGSGLIQLSELAHGPGAPQVTLSPATGLPDLSIPILHLGWLEAESAGLALTDSLGDRLASVEQVDPDAAQLIVNAPVAISGRRVGTAANTRIFAQTIFPIYDLQIISADDPATIENFAAVILTGQDRYKHLSVVNRINSGPAPSALVRAEELDPRRALSLPRGSERRLFVDCLSARFDNAEFDKAHFAGGPCLEQGIFNVSRFAESPRAASTPVFAPVSGGGTADLTLSWQNHLAASAQINLPLDMPARFGARFDMDRFALADDAPESVAGLVTEPPGDEDHFASRLDPDSDPNLRESQLLVARHANSVPIGFAPINLPFARPKALSGGRAGLSARLFLSDPGISGFIELAASVPGAHGNRISVIVCDSGPGRFDLLVAFDGARFENARQRVSGPALTGTPADLSKPGPRGVQHLKAAGVHLTVTREGTPPENSNC